MDVITPTTPHEEYVAKGYCPAVHDFKCWCIQQDGHDGDHFSLYLHPDGRFQVYPRWD